MKKAAIYARVSTEDQNAAMQVEELQAMCKRRGWELYNEYIDGGFSGIKTSRPALDQMMKDARRRKFDIVLVWKFDRFARSTKHLLSALDEFRSLGIDFFSYSENIDTSTPMGEMIFTIFAALAQFERALIVERVNAGMAHAKKHGTRSGKAIGRPVSTTFDVALAMELRDQEVSWRKIAKQLGVSQTTIRRRLNQRKEQQINDDNAKSDNA